MQIETVSPVIITSEPTPSSAKWPRSMQSRKR